MNLETSVYTAFRSARFVAVLGLLVACILLTAPVAAEERQALRDALERTGLLDQIRELPLALEQAGREIEAVSADQNFGNDFRTALKETFDADAMVAECVSYFETGYPEEYVQQLEDFLRTPLGERVTSLEKEAAKVANQRTVETVGKRIHESLPELEPDRLDIYREIANELGLFENTEAIASNAAYAVMVGVFSSNKGPVTLPEGMINDLLRANQNRMRGEVRKSIEYFMAFAYRELSLDELGEYLAFSKTAASRKFYSIAFDALDGLMVPRSREFGRRLIELRNEQKI